MEWLALLACVLLILVCGGFVAAEFSFVTVDRASVDRLAESGDVRARGVQAALQALSTQLSGAQLGITITNLAIGFLAEPAIAKLVDGPLDAVGVPAGAVGPVSLALGLAIATALTMVFGELVPKNLAIARPLPTATATQGFQRGFTRAMAIPIRALNGTANRVVRALGVEPQEELRSARSAEELSSLVRRSASQGTLDASTAGLMQRTLAFGGRTTGDIMTPRVRMDAVDADAPVNEVIQIAQRTGHSRFPVIDGDVDDVVGAVHVKQAVTIAVEHRWRSPVRSIMVPTVVAPESLPLDPLLTLLRGEGLQMAVVVDEYGGTAGVVTLEDVVEEIVGDIADEHDRSGAGARGRHDGSWSLSGLLRPDEIAELTRVRLPEHEDYDTVAGLVLRELGRMADVGDVVEIPLAEADRPGEEPEARHDAEAARDQPAAVARLTVEQMDGRRIDRVVLAVAQPAAADEPLPAAQEATR